MKTVCGKPEKMTGDIGGIPPPVYEKDWLSW